MTERKISIKEEYDHELSEINYVLTQLENGRVLELKGGQGDGYLAHNAQKLRKMIADLVNKIEKQKPSDGNLDDVLFNSKED